MTIAKDMAGVVGNMSDDETLLLVKAIQNGMGTTFMQCPTEREKALQIMQAKMQVFIDKHHLNPPTKRRRQYS